MKLLSRTNLCPTKGIRKLCVQGDSRLAIEQVNEKFSLKEIALVVYELQS